MHHVSKIAAVLFLALNTTGALADKSKGAENLLADTNGNAKISVDEHSGFARFIRLQPTSQLGPVRSQARSAKANTSRSSKVDTGNISVSFLRDYGSAFGVQNVDTELSLVSTNRDKLGSSHSIFKQNYKGLPVFAGELRTHFNSNGEMIAVNGKFLTDIKVIIKPVLTAQQAAGIAFRKVEQDPTKAVNDSNAGNKEDRMGTPAALLANSSTLMIFRAGLVKGTPGQDHLAYEIEVVNGAGNVREFVYVDAINGMVIDQITGIHDALDRRAYDAENAAHPGPNYPDTPFWVEGDALPNGTTEADNMIYASAETYSLFDNAFGRDSFDAVGATMDAIFNRGDSCPNASWNGTYISFCAGLTSDDVTAHEWGHAYTQYTNNLIYQWQPGALNESYSDIWGDTVDRINGRDDLTAPDVARTDGSCSIYSGDPSGDDSVRWLIGEDAAGFGGAIRDMWNPTCHGDPGKVTDAEYFCGTGDQGGVHSNSGVPNHAYALMADGGSYNGFSDTGLGLTKSAHIHWAAQNMLTPSSNFFDHADALETSCAALTGIDLADLSDGSATGEIITSGDCAQVAAIIDAVELRTPATQCGYEPILAEAPALCESQGSVESFFSEDFEAGLPAGWTVSSHDVVDAGTFDSPGWTVTDDLPSGADGIFAAFAPNLIAGNCQDDTEAGVINLDSPDILLPASLTAHVAFNHWVATEAGWDGGNLKLSVNDGPFVVIPASAYSFNPYNGVINNGDNPLSNQPAFTGTDGGSVSGSWGQSQVKLYGLASPGDTIQLRFDLGTDDCNGLTGWYVDSVEAYSCSAELPPVCGDGVLDLLEMCDDGNSVNGDGCSSSCQVESGFACAAPTGPTDSSNVVTDWSFEGGVPNDDWIANSTFTGPPEFPLCGPSNGCPAVPTNSGDWIVWIGGIASGVSSSVTQEINIPASASELTLNVLRGVCDTGDVADSIQVIIDGTNEIGTIVCDGTENSFVEYSFPIAPFNDGQVHTLEISGTVGGVSRQSNFFVDDVAIEDNTPKPAMPSVCTAFVADIACNVDPVGFDGGIAPSWTVVDNAGTGVVWSSIADSGIAGNLTGGSGDAASANSDANAFVEFDTELHSNSFSLAGYTGATLEYLVDYQNLSQLDFLNLDISTDGGTSWTNMLSWNEDHPVGGLLNTTGESVLVDLTHYAGEADVKLRWHYFDNNSGDWDWYAQVDDVSLACDNVPQALRCDVNLDGFVDRSDIGLIAAARGQAAAAGDPRDNDGNGIISSSDARQCVQLCTLSRCATP